MWRNLSRLICYFFWLCNHTQYIVLCPFRKGSMSTSTLAQYCRLNIDSFDASSSIASMEPSKQPSNHESSLSIIVIFRFFITIISRLRMQRSSYSFKFSLRCRNQSFSIHPCHLWHYFWRT